MARENSRYTSGFGPPGKRNGRKHSEMPAIDRDLETLAVERDADGFVRTADVGRATSYGAGSALASFGGALAGGGPQHSA